MAISPTAALNLRVSSSFAFSSLCFEAASSSFCSLPSCLENSLFAFSASVMPALFISSSCSVRASTLADNSLCFPSASLRFWISWSSRALGMRPSSFQSARYFFSSSVSCSPATIFPMTSLSSIFCSLLFATSAFNVLADGVSQPRPSRQQLRGRKFSRIGRIPRKTAQAAKNGATREFTRFRPFFANLPTFWPFLRVPYSCPSCAMAAANARTASLSAEGEDSCIFLEIASMADCGNCRRRFNRTRAVCPISRW